MYDTTEKAKKWLENIKESEEEYDPLITYLFINKSLGMSPGKLGVQTARAGQVMLLKEYSKDDTCIFDSLYELFQDDFMHGNKTISLKANANQMNRILNGDIGEQIKLVSKTNDVPIRLYPVYDIGATEVETNSLTVIAMTPVRESIIKDTIRKFQLYK